MSDVISDLLESADPTLLESWTPDGTELERIGEIAASMVELQHAVAAAEEALKATKERLRIVQEGQLPAAMEQAGLSELRLESGEKIVVSNFYGCSIDAARKEQAFDWLHDNGHGDIVKHTVSLDFKKGEADQAGAAVDALRKEGFDPAEMVKDAPQTLKAFARVEVEAGRQLPDCFKLYIGQKANIK